MCTDGGGADYEKDGLDGGLRAFSAFFVAQGASDVVDKPVCVCRHRENGSCSWFLNLAA